MEPSQEQIKALVAKLNEATKKEVITIETREEENLALTDSKFGGYPYVPRMDISPEIVRGILSLW